MIPINSQNKKNTQLVRILLFSILALSTSIGSYSQKNVTGTIVDETGVPLPGVSIISKNTSKGSISDVNGKYSIQTLEKDIITFSFTGMVKQLVNTVGKDVINIVMKEDAVAINELVVVGYGVQRKQSLTSSVSTINGDALLKAPSTNVTQMLAGRLPGVSSVQESGEPGMDGAAVRIRGSMYDPTYIVDGFPRSISEIDPNDIESLSVLKDASSASVYGLKAGGGVIIVTTKKGSAGKPKIKYDGSIGVSMNANFPKFLDGPQYAYYYNIADMMDKLANGTLSNPNQYSPIFSQQNIRDMQNGSNGWGNINYIDEVFGMGINQKHNISAQGGTDQIRYFTSIGYLGQKGNIANFLYNRFNLRSNIEATIANNLNLTIGMTGLSGQRSTPGFASGGTDANSSLGEIGWMSIANQTLRMHPYVPIMYGENYSATASSYGAANSPLAAIYKSGNRNLNTNQIQSNVALTFKVPGVKGLSLRASGSYDFTTSHYKDLATPYYVEMVGLPISYSSTLEHSNVLDARGEFTNTLKEEQTTISQTVGQASISYLNSLKKHTVDFLGLVEVQEWKYNNFSAGVKNLPFSELPELNFGDPTDIRPVGSSNLTRSIGYVARLKYDYDNKYLAELTGRYDGSYKFAGNVLGKRWGFFPSGSLAWRLSKEDFMKELNYIDDMKLRASVGLLGSDNVSPYRFLSTYSSDNSIMLNGVSNSAMYTTAVPNPNLTWEKTLSYNVGLEFSMWNGLLHIDMDAFYNYTYDILTQLGGDVYPSSMGGYYSQWANYNKADAKGLDFEVSHRSKFIVAGKSFNYGVTANASWTVNRWLRFAGDQQNTQAWFKVTGSDVYANYGWVAKGLYRSEAQIDKSAWYEGSRPNIGDIEYEDTNGDGKIDSQDKRRIGQSNRPNLTYGLNINMEWNGFDFSALLSGGALFDVSLTGTYYNGYDDSSVWSKTFKDGYNSPLYLVENAVSIYNPDGTMPRITAGGLSHGGKNHLSSTFWMVDGSYIRLKSAQLGYNLPKLWLKQVGLDNIRIYIEGSNLFTISGLPQGIDPESPRVNNGYYPQQKLLMGGFTLTF